MPGSGGTYVYLREGLRPREVGPAHGLPLHLAVHPERPARDRVRLHRLRQYARYVWPGLTACRHDRWSPSPSASLNIALLYRQITSIGALTVTLWVGTLITTLAVIVDGRRALRSGGRVRLPARGVQLFDRLPAWPRRRDARGCLRLPRLLRHLLHRRRGQRPGPDDPAIDHHQHHRGRPDLRRHQPLRHRRGALAGVRPGRRSSGRVVHRVGLHGDASTDRASRRRSPR